MSSPGPESVSKHTVSRRAQKKPERNKTKQEGKIRPFVRAVERKGFGDHQNTSKTNIDVVLCSDILYVVQIPRFLCKSRLVTLLSNERGSKRPIRLQQTQIIETGQSGSNRPRSLKTGQSDSNRPRSFKIDQSGSTAPDHCKQAEFASSNRPKLSQGSSFQSCWKPA